MSRTCCWCAWKDAVRNWPFAPHWARDGSASRRICCLRASCWACWAACSDCYWRTRLCASWLRWRQPAFRVSAKSASTYPVLLFTLALALFTSLLIAVLPIFKYAGGRVNASLREGGRALSQSRERHRARNALVILQVALALVLLICSGLMIRTFRALMHVPPGFTAPETVQTFRLYVPETQIPDSDARARGSHGEADPEQSRGRSGCFLG